MRRTIASVGMMLCISCAAFAQPAIPSDEIHSRTAPYVVPSRLVLHSEVRVVEVPVVVRDAQHRAVAGLRKDDFEVYDQGKKQAITAFSVGGTSNSAESKGEPRPRFLALCFDDLHVDSASLKQAKGAAEHFVRTSLVPGDRVAVVTTSQSTKSVFTADVATLLEQIARITPAPQATFTRSEPLACTRISPEEAYQITNEQAENDRTGGVLRQKLTECSACQDHRAPCHEEVIKAAADEIWRQVRSVSMSTLGIVDTLVDSMAKLPGQRTILLTSDGFLVGTMEVDVDRLTAKALHAEVVINTLDARGVNRGSSNARGTRTYVANRDSQGMAALASGTGGTFCENQNDLEEGFRELGMAPSTMYVLSFAPSGSPDAHFHKLKVQVDKKYLLQARQGYMALRDESASPVSKLDSAVIASDTITDLPVSFSWQQWDGPPGVTMIAHLDIGRLHFKPWQDRQTQRLIIVAVILDSHGTFVEGKRSDLELSFRDATFSRLKETGLPVALTIKAPPGSYSVRAVAQDAMESKFATANGAVQIK